MSKKLSALSFNLLPKKVRRGITLKIEDKILIGIFILLILLSGMSLYFFSSFNRQLRSEILAIDRELADYTLLKERISTLEKGIATITKLESAAVKLGEEATSLRWVFLELQRLTPQGVVFSSLNIERSGKTVSIQAEAVNLRTVSEFIASVKSSKDIEKIDSNNFSLDKTTGRVNFPVNITLKRVK